MDFSAIIMMLAAKFPIVTLIAAVLGMLVVVGQAVVVMTPSKADDEKWEQIKAMPIIGQLISALVNFAPIQKK
jgi:hypothetical protein